MSHMMILKIGRRRFTGVSCVTTKVRCSMVVVISSLDFLMPPWFFWLTYTRFIVMPSFSFCLNLP
jgi:hypothetical protein